VTRLNQNNSIVLIKIGEFNDENQDGGLAQEGETITYRFTVINNGNTNIQNIVITDPLPGIVINGGPIDLAPGESDSTTFTATYSITQADISAGEVINQATVIGQDANGNNVSDLSDKNDPLGDDPTVVLLIDNLNVINVSCNGDNDGSISSVIIGGVAPHTIVLGGDGNQTITSNDGNFTFSNLAPGSYTLTITDNNNACPAILNTIITEPDPIVISLDSTTDINCSTDAFGQIVVIASGGTAPYTYIIDDANTTTQDNGTFTGLLPGTYTIIVIDDNGCEAALENIVIESIENDTIFVTGEEACIDDGIIDLDRFLINGELPGGIWELVQEPANATFISINSDNEFDPINATLGDYVFTYTITTDNGCTNVTEVNLNINDICRVLACQTFTRSSISQAVTPNGDGVNDFFEIRDIELCGFNVRLQMFNRWGSLVFESNNYQGEWRGQSSRNSVGGSNTLPSGTYYYIVVLENSGLEPLNGPIYLGTK